MHVEKQRASLKAGRGLGDEATHACMCTCVGVKYLHVSADSYTNNLSKYKLSVDTSAFLGDFYIHMYLYKNRTKWKPIQCVEAKDKSFSKK